MTREEYIKNHVVNCTGSKYDVYCGRPSKYGNMYKIGKDGSRADVIRKYEKNFPLSDGDLEDLKDKILACFCHPLPCHCDIIAGKIWDKYYNES